MVRPAPREGARSFGCERGARGSPRRRLALGRALAGASLAVLALSLGPSCSSLLDIDDYEDAGGALCDLLGRCYAKTGLPGCEGRLDDRLDQAESEPRSAWLQRFADQRCLENCTAARGCLDLSPVCGALGEACARREDCCGFTKGRADCDAKRSKCCVPRGVPCSSNADCCAGAGACELALAEGYTTCGGVVCSTPGKACANGFDCCTGVCDATGKCAETPCGDDGFECTTGAACCSGYCGPSGRCEPPPCALRGAPCEVDGDCCTELCYRPDPSQPGVCSEGGCFPNGFDCASDTQCCSHHCDLTYFRCGLESCKTLGEACESGLECCSGGCSGGVCSLCSTELCQIDADCCTGSCEGGKCVAGSCSEPACHPVCEEGPPLDDGCDHVGACAADVCAAHPICCCSGWDAICVALAAGLCDDDCLP